MLHVLYDNEIAISNGKNETPFLRGTIFKAGHGLEDMVGLRVQVWGGKGTQTAQLLDLQGKAVEVLATIGDETILETSNGAEKVVVSLFGIEVLETYGDDQRTDVKRQMMVAQRAAQRNNTKARVKLAARAGAEASAAATPATAPADATPELI